MQNLEQLDDNSEQKIEQGSKPDDSRAPIWNVKLGFPKQENVLLIPKDLTTGHRMMTNRMMMVPTMRKQAMKNLLLKELMTRRQILKFPKMSKNLVAGRPRERNHICYYNPTSCF